MLRAERKHIMIYNKLVRDRIPRIIRENGQFCVTEVLPQGAYQEKLDEKLAEELAEYRESHDMEELADLMEVILACAAARGCSESELNRIRMEKKQTRGGFSERILLRSTASNPLGACVTVTIDRPKGSRHPEHPDILYPIHYGYIAGIPAPDGEDQDAYILGVDAPVETVIGTVIAVIHRLDDVEDKWVVAPEGMTFSSEEIEAAVAFQERFFRHTLFTV